MLVLSQVKVVHICEATLTKRLIEFENTESGSLTVCLLQLTNLTNVLCICNMFHGNILLSLKNSSLDMSNILLQILFYYCQVTVSDSI